MGYTKTTWAADTEITSSLLNHLETQYAAAAYDVDNHDHGDDYYTETEMNSGFWHAGNTGPGSGCDADTIEGHEASYFAGIGAPAGLIIWYAGSDEPSGWYDCDGENGTPDLRDRFVVGAGDTYAVNGTGGAASITPPATITVAAHALIEDEIPSHSHSYVDYYPEGISYIYYASGGTPKCSASGHTRNTGSTGGGQGHGHSGSTFTGDSQENRPPFYALKLIMKG